MKKLPHGKISGFTLLELLVVIVILGIAAAIVVPQVGAGLSSTKITTAARTVAQASRYARTMALLHQAETELVLTPENGTIEVHAKSRGAVAASLQEIANERKTAISAAGENLDDTTIFKNKSADVATAQSFADEVDSKFVCDGIKFKFLGYADSFDNDTAGSADMTQEDGHAPIVVLYRSNGTCRPYKVRVMIDEDEHADVSIDITGAGKIDGYDE